MCKLTAVPWREEWSAECSVALHTCISQISVWLIFDNQDSYVCKYFCTALKL